MKLISGRLVASADRRSKFVRLYMGGGIAGFYLVLFKRWYLYVDWIR